jgi:hypothetical protein
MVTIDGEVGSLLEQRLLLAETGYTRFVKYCENLCATRVLIQPPRSSPQTPPLWSPVDDLHTNLHVSQLYPSQSYNEHRINYPFKVYMGVRCRI